MIVKQVKIILSYYTCITDNYTMNMVNIWQKYVLVHHTTQCTDSNKNNENTRTNEQTNKPHVPSEPQAPFSWV